MNARKPGPAGALLSGSSVYLASNVFIAALWFAVLPVLTRFMSPSDYGAAAMFATLVGALGAVVGLNAPAATARRYYDGLSQQELSRALGASLQILAASTALSLAVVLAFARPLASLLGLHRHWLPWAVLAAAMACIVQLRQVQWQVRGVARPYAALQSGEAALNALISLVLVAGLALGATGRIAASIVSVSSAAAVALAVLARAGMLAPLSWDPSQLASLLRFGVPLVPHIAASFLLMAADRVVVTSKLGLTQAGIYMLAAHLAQAAALVFDAINKAYVPWLFERLSVRDPAQERRIVRYTYAWFALLLAAALLAFEVGPWLVVLVGGNRYADAGRVIGWLLLGQTFSGMYLMVTNYVFYARRTGLLSGATVASGSLNVVLLLVLTPRLGIQGAGIAFSVAMGVRFVLTWWVAQRSHAMPWWTAWRDLTDLRPR